MQIINVFLLLNFLNQVSARHSVVLEWAAPYLSGGGYCSEAFAYIQALESIGFASSVYHTKNEINLVQHGDSYNQVFVSNMRATDSSLIKKLSKGALRASSSSSSSSSSSYKISVCHSEPGAWYTPSPNYHTQACPPRDANYKIGRTM
jgi:hypothetical protein